MTSSLQQGAGIAATTGISQPALTPSTKYTYGQIEGLWIAGGGDPSMAPLMAAIAFAESGGHPDEITDTPDTGDYSVGLWQINYYDGLLQSRTAAFGPPAQLALNPLAQAKAAVSILHSQGLSAWTTYTRGNYQQFYTTGVAPIPWTGGGGSLGGAGGASGNADGSGGVENAGLFSLPANCAFGLPFGGLSVCILTKKQARQLAGILLTVGGSAIALIGLGIVVAQGFRRSDLSKAINKAVASLPVVGAAGQAAVAEDEQRDERRQESTQRRQRKQEEQASSPVSPPSPATPAAPEPLEFPLPPAKPQTSSSNGTSKSKGKVPAIPGARKSGGRVRPPRGHSNRKGPRHVH